MTFYKIRRHSSPFVDIDVPTYDEANAVFYAVIANYPGVNVSLLKITNEIKQIIIRQHLVK